MTDNLSAMFDSIVAARGVLVTFASGGQSLDVYALPGSTQYEAQDESGAVAAFKSRDYLVRASDLVLAGEAVKPARFDTITEGEATCEVKSPAGGQVYAWVDPYHTIMRIHTLENDGIA